LLIDQKEFIKKGARYFQNKKAFVFKAGKPHVIEGTSLTYGEVDERASKLANALSSLDHSPGARVAALAQNCLHYPEIEFGLIKGAFTQVVLNPMLSAKELHFQISISKASVLIFQHRYFPIVSSIRSQIPTVKQFICFEGKAEGCLDYEILLDSASSEEPKEIINPDGMGQIRFTSGTTGIPKGIILPFKSGAAVTRDLIMEYLGDLNYNDRWLAIQPLFHGAGWFTLPVWVKGMTQYIVNDFHAESALKIIEKEKITAIKTIPTVLMRLLDSPEIKKYDLKNIKTIIYGGETMPAQRLKDSINIFGKVFVQLYGQTEAPMIITVMKKEDYDNENLYTSAGRPATMVKVKIVDHEGREAAPGEIGEVVVTGDHLMNGYLDNEKATNEVMREGWLHTKDIGKLDENGYLFLTGGRSTDMIISGGENIYPQEVEQVLYQHIAVKEACVFGLPDNRWGESVVATVSLKPNFKVCEEELINFCKEKLAGYKKPQKIYILENLPKSGSEKIVRKHLRMKFSKLEKQG
jgi:acyl-CoA synthetase (AMP-forming)/AMP-acid ligase II